MRTLVSMLFLLVPSGGWAIPAPHRVELPRTHTPAPLLKGRKKRQRLRKERFGDRKFGRNENRTPELHFPVSWAITCGWIVHVTVRNVCAPRASLLTEAMCFHLDSG